MKIKSIIIDDEPLAREGLKNYFKQIDFVELVASFSNPLQAAKRLNEGSIDLMLLDIQMPGLNGLEFLKSLKEPPLVIISTAYPDYALEGFELDVMDYLVKPIPFEKFLKAVNKAKDYLELLKKARGRYAAGDDYIFVKAGGKFEKIRFGEILFIEAMQNYVIIHTAGKKYITYYTMKGILKSLPEDKFLRVQKSYIIAISKVDSIEGAHLRIGEHLIPVSRAAKKRVLKQIINNKLIKK